MATASPESFRGLLKRAEEIYDKAKELTQGKDKDGFIRLISWESIDQAVNNLAEMKGALQEKIKELAKNSPQKRKYEECLRKTECLLSELRKKQEK